MSLYESLLELRCEPLTIDVYNRNSKLYNLLHSYRPENDYYRYESNNLLIMCCRKQYSGIYMIRNHELIIIIEMYDHYYGCDCFSLYYLFKINNQGVIVFDSS